MSAEPAEPIEVGVYEAKTHLSQLLDQVEAGNVISITRHGKRVARLIPEPVAEAPARRPFGIWPDYKLPDGWDDFTKEDEALWYGEMSDADWIAAGFDPHDDATVRREMGLTT